MVTLFKIAMSVMIVIALLYILYIGLMFSKTKYRYIDNLMMVIITLSFIDTIMWLALFTWVVSL